MNVHLTSIIGSFIAFTRLSFYEHSSLWLTRIIVEKKNFAMFNYVGFVSVNLAAKENINNQARFLLFHCGL